MSIENFSLSDEIYQIDQENQRLLEHIEMIKDKADAARLPHLEEMEKHAHRVSLEINEISKKQNKGAEIIHISEA